MHLQPFNPGAVIGGLGAGPITGHLGLPLQQPEAPVFSASTPRHAPTGEQWLERVRGPSRQERAAPAERKCTKEVIVSRNRIGIQTAVIDVPCPPEAPTTTTDKPGMCRKTIVIPTMWGHPRLQSVMAPCVPEKKSWCTIL